MIAGLLCFGIGMAAETSVPYAGVYIVVMLVVWWLLGRRGSGLLGALVAPPLAAVRLGLAAPLLTGFSIPPLRAGALGGMGAIVTIIASAASGGRPPYLLVNWEWFLDPFATRIVNGNVGALVQQPGTLAVIVAWTAAAVVMSLACQRASRVWALGGLAMSVGVLYAGYLLADVLANTFNTSATWTGEALLVGLMASSILVVLVIAAGAPVRAEEE
jgi:hypothetical protein